MTAEPEPPRWHSRLDTFHRAVGNLTDAVISPDASPELRQAIERHGVDWPITPARP